MKLCMILVKQQSAIQYSCSITLGRVALIVSHLISGGLSFIPLGMLSLGIYLGVGVAN